MHSVLIIGFRHQPLFLFACLHLSVRHVSERDQANCRFQFILPSCLGDLRQNPTDCLHRQPGKVAGKRNMHAPATQGAACPGRTVFQTHIFFVLCAQVCRTNFDMSLFRQGNPLCQRQHSRSFLFKHPSIGSKS